MGSLMTILSLIAVISFMGVKLPAFGSTEAGLKEAGFTKVATDVNVSPENGTFSKSTASSALGRVRVRAVTVKNSVEVLSISCLGKRLCAGRPPGNAGRCVQIGPQAWRCSQQGIDFE